MHLGTSTCLCDNICGIKINISGCSTSSAELTFEKYVFTYLYTPKCNIQTYMHMCLHKVLLPIVPVHTNCHFHKIIIK